MKIEFARLQVSTNREHSLTSLLLDENEIKLLNKSKVIDRPAEDFFFSNKKTLIYALFD